MYVALWSFSLGNLVDGAVEFGKLRVDFFETACFEEGHVMLGTRGGGQPASEEAGHSATPRGYDVSGLAMGKAQDHAPDVECVFVGGDQAVASSQGF